MYATVAAFLGKYFFQLLFGAVIVGTLGIIAWNLYHAGVIKQAAVDQPKITAVTITAAVGRVSNQVQTDTLKADVVRITSEEILSKQTQEGVTDVTAAGLKAMQAPLPPDLIAAYQRVIDGMRQCELNPHGPGCAH